jgi:RNA polymerase sigma-70 factor (ECF subfamily)
MFERLYRAEVKRISGYFSLHSHDPHVVADLTSETFLQAMRSFSSFDASRGSGRGWLFAIARRVESRYWAQTERRQDAASRAAASWALEEDDAVDALVERIDAQRLARQLLTRLPRLDDLSREAIELVDVAGFKPHEAAEVLGVSPGSLRIRLFRARSHLRKGGQE